MFNCTACSLNPFSYLFKSSDNASNISSSSELSLSDDEVSTSVQVEKNHDISKWIKYIHPRAELIYNDYTSIIEEIAANIKNKIDILNEETECAIWTGKFLDDKPVIYINNEPKEVKSILIDLFADDFSREHIDLNNIAFVCESNHCVNMKHILVD